MQLHSLLDRHVTVITASRRLAHALRLDYARSAQSRGTEVWRTPLILPWPAWLRQQWIDARAAARGQHLRLLTSRQAGVIWSEVVADSSYGANLLNPTNAARLAARSWERMQEYLIPLEHIARADSAETQALHAWCSEFIRRCEVLRAIDEPRLSAWAFEANIVPEEPVALAGFDTLVPSVQRLIECWRTHGKVHDYERKATSQLSVVTLQARDSEAEIDLAARWARAQLESGRERIGVLLGDLQSRRADVARVFADIFAPGQRVTGATAASLPITIAAPQPLASYPIVDAAVLALQFAMPDCTSTHAGRLLRSPFLAGSESESDRRAMADFRLRDEQRDRWDWLELERWAGVTGCEQLQLAARNVSTLVRAETAKVRPSRWAERFHAWLRAAGWPGERSLDSVEHQTVAKFNAALAELGMLDAVMSNVTLATALTRLQELLRDTPFEPETHASAVTVIDPATVAGMTFDAVWVAGLDATRLPGPINPDPLLPLDVQRAAGVPEASAEGVLQQARTRLQRWISCAPEVILSWPEQDGEAALQPSPLLAPWSRLTPGDLQFARVRPLRSTLFEHRSSLIDSRDDYAPPVLPGAARGGAAILELQSRCPFRAQAELRLRAAPVCVVSIGLEPAERGTILHRVLDDIWGALGTQEALLSLDETTLAERVRDAAQRQATQVLRPTTRHRARLAALEVESVVRQVCRLLQLEKQRSPFVPLRTEAAEPYVIGGLAVTLRPDRIDTLEGGGQLLIDYKLGDSHLPRQWLDTRPGRPLRPQLPLYALAHQQSLRALAFVVLAPGTVEYRGWSDGVRVGTGVYPYPGGSRPRATDPPDWSALVQHWRTTLTTLAEQFVSGYAAVDPLQAECRVCHLSTLCRKHEQSLTEDESNGDE